MDFKTAREQRGITLEQAAQLSGYAIATINGLELHQQGSERLKARLIDIYGLRKSFNEPVELHETAPAYHAVPDIGAMLDDLEAEFNERLKRIRKMLNYSTSRKPRTGSITSDVEKATREFLNAGKKG